MYSNDFFQMYRRWDFFKKNIIASPLVNKIRKPVVTLARQTGDVRGGPRNFVTVHFSDVLPV